MKYIIIQWKRRGKKDKTKKYITIYSTEEEIINCHHNLWNYILRLKILVNLDRVEEVTKPPISL